MTLSTRFGERSRRGDRRPLALDLEGGADEDPDPRQADPEPTGSQRALGSDHADRDERGSRRECEPGGAAHVRPAPVREARALREDPEHLAVGEEPSGAAERRRVARAALDREGAERVHDPGEQRVPPELRLRHVADPPRRGRAEDERVDERLVVGDEDRRAPRRNLLGPGELDPVERLHEGPEADRVEDGVEDHDGQARRRGPREHELGVAERTRPKRRLAERQVEVPGALEALVVAERPHLVEPGQEPLAPAAQRLRVARTDLLEPAHREARRTSPSRRRAPSATGSGSPGRRSARSSRASSGSGRSARRGRGSSGRTRRRPARAAGRGPRSRSETAARRSPRSSRWRRSSCTSRGARGSPPPGSSRARRARPPQRAARATSAWAGERVSPVTLRPVLAGRDAGEAPPAAADLEDAVVGAEPELLAHLPQLPELRLLERLVRTLEDGAGVRHRLVEEEGEEVVAEVVVVLDVAPGAEARVPAREPRACVGEASPAPGGARPPPRRFGAGARRSPTRSSDSHSPAW